MEMCKECGFVASTAKNLKLHFVKLHKEIDPVYCETCEKSFKSRYEYNLHMQDHKSDQFRCDHCGKKLASNQSLKSHISALHQLIAEQSCKFCDKVFTKKFDYQKHCQEHREAKDSQTCSICNKKSKNVLLHTKLFHLQVKAFKCDPCDKKYSTSQAVKYHNDTIHATHLPNLHCDKCDFETSH